MRFSSTDLPEVLLIEPDVFSDARGFFFESFNAKRFAEVTGLSADFVQDNHSLSKRGTLRGLHYQLSRPQGKLVRVVEGAVFDVAVDIRQGSPSFGQWVGVELTAENKKQLWVPPDFAHGFVVTSDAAQVLYKATDFYSPEHERSIIWSDETIAIDWPDLGVAPILSSKDADAPNLRVAELPRFDS
jgi:dTDP-4-dehydrorhamnose 3,5-epimerase